MKKAIFLIITCFSSVLSGQNFIQGMWHVPESPYNPELVLQFSKSHDRWFAKILWVSPQEHQVYLPQKHQAIKKLENQVLVWGLRQAHDNPNTATYGHVLAPGNNTEYMCSIEYNPKKDTIDFYGYTAPLLGKHFTWDRISSNKFIALKKQDS